MFSGKGEWDWDIENWNIENGGNLGNFRGRENF